MLLSAVQRQLINVIENWDLQRTYPPSESIRTEGFTEDWGLDDEDEEEDSDNENEDREENEEE